MLLFKSTVSEAEKYHLIKLNPLSNSIGPNNIYKESDPNFTGITSLIKLDSICSHINHTLYSDQNSY